MKKNGYSEILLNTFLLNAGVVGFLRTCEFAQRSGQCCQEGSAYIIEGQSLFISNDFLMKENLGDLFVKALVDKLSAGTKYERILSQKDKLDKLFSNPASEDKEWLKSTNEIFKSFTDMLEKSSFKSGYEILSNLPGLCAPTADMVLTMKSERDLTRKKALLDELYKLMQQPKVREILTFKDILYTRINMFYSDNKGNGAAFLSKREMEPAEAFNIDFLQPVRDELSDPGKKTLHCIECGEAIDKKNAVSITKFVDTADDLGKKKSYYWNCRPDAYLCPLCALICAMSPLGFTYFGADGLFVNNNSKVGALMAYSNLLEQNTNPQAPNKWYALCNALTSEKLTALEKRADNIQVIVREYDTASYSMNTVDRQTVSVLEMSKRQLEHLKSIVVKHSKEYINVYQSVVSNVLHRRSQFPLISNLLRYSIEGEGRSSSYIYDILTIQINQKGGNDVESNTKRAFVAKKEGEKLRKSLTESVQERDKDNKLRGTVYQLLNAVSLCNRDKFLELTLRVYSGYNLPVPDIFFTCFGSDEDFKEIGFAFILGLKSEGYKKEEASAQ